MRTKLAIVAVCLCRLLTACAEGEERGGREEGGVREGTGGEGRGGRERDEEEAAARGASPRGPVLAAGEETPRRIAGTTADGKLALFDGATGELLSSAAAGETGPIADIACDPFLSRVLSVEQAEGEEWGELVTHALDAGSEEGSPALGAGEHLVWIDGVARVAATPVGAVEFQESYGERWKLLPEGGAPTPGAPARVPVSIAVVPGDGGPPVLLGLPECGLGGEQNLLSAMLTPAGVGAVAAQPLFSLPLSDPGDCSVRWARSKGGEHVIAVTAGEVGVFSSAGAGGVWGPRVPVALGAAVEGVESAVGMEGAPVVVALVTGAIDVAAVRLSPSGEVECATSLDLLGEVASSRGRLGRGLTAAGPLRALAATSEGVFGLALSEGCPLALEVDAAFSGDALRGPLDACPPWF